MELQDVEVVDEGSLGAPDNVANGQNAPGASAGGENAPGAQEVGVVATGEGSVKGVNNAEGGAPALNGAPHREMRARGSRRRLRRQSQRDDGHTGHTEGSAGVYPYRLEGVGPIGLPDLPEEPTSSPVLLHNPCSDLYMQISRTYVDALADENNFLGMLPCFHLVIVKSTLLFGCANLWPTCFSHKLKYLCHK